MKIQYFDETDTLYIELQAGPATNTEVIAFDLMVDFDTQGKVIGITIDNYSKNSTAAVQLINLPEFAA